MGAEEKTKKHSQEEYLELERLAESKSEYYKGEIFAMAGASLTHNLICKNLIIFLGTQLKGKNCQPVGSDMRLHIPSKGFYTYPDVSVYCGKPLLLDHHFDVLLNPVFLCEVLSPSTALYDIEKKFEFYHSIPSLKEYWAISSYEYKCQRFIRNEDDTWLLTETTDKHAVVPLRCFDLMMPLEEIYRDVEI